ncbi:uncharacterized protein LOC129580707 isoform X2 [Paramacrobiotus metropolitanus]|uniref:uncharacterized protein LOC129580707 isoform X2 n=1 Tax=Paramacrobiotus metropolitanus TaxID=2943436 RepID=UPI00244620B0|nr:uncharacterized protein LOC129580707 isoform X2 [Paramacrobiotus metropolitanus]
MEDDYASPWDNFQSIVASDLGVPATHIDGSSTYSQHGGTSINILSTILKLQQAGHAVTLEQLMQQDLNSLMQYSAPSGESGPRYNFSVRYLEDAEEGFVHQVFVLIGESFTQKCEMFSTAGNMTVNDFVDMFKTWWVYFSKYSFAVVDEKGIPRAASLNADQVDLTNAPIDKIHPHFVKIGEMLDEITKPAEHKYNPELKKGIVFTKLFVGASVKNTPEENVVLINMVEVENKLLAERLRFQITLAENASPVTQDISAHLGCIRPLAGFLQNVNQPTCKAQQPVPKYLDSRHINNYSQHERLYLLPHTDEHMQYVVSTGSYLNSVLQ